MLDHIALKLDREGKKGREKSKRGERGGGGIFRGRRLFQIFPSNGGKYSREEIDQGTAIIRGNTVSKKATHNSSLADPVRAGKIVIMVPLYRTPLSELRQSDSKNVIRYQYGQHTARCF